MNNSSVRSKLGQILVLQAFEEQPVLEQQPHLLSRGCLHVQEEVEQGADQARGLGLADGVQEGPHVLQESSQLCKNHTTWNATPQPRAAPSWSSHTSHAPAGFVPPNISQVVFQHHPQNRATNATCRAAWSRQDCTGPGGSSLTPALPATVAPQLPPAVTASPLKCQGLPNALRFFYKIRDGVYNYVCFY